jgi:hypothetical protein
MFVSKSKRKIQPILELKTTEAMEATVSQDTKIEFTSLNECSICMEINYNQVIITDCNHEFHEKCLFEWMKNSPTCPICRKQLAGT